MKLLMVISSLGIGGAETHFCSLVCELQKMGEEVIAVSSGGELCGELEKRGIRHVRLPLGRKDPLSMLRCYFAMRRLVKEEGIELIHAHSRIAAYICERVSRSERIPFVTTAHARFSIDPIKHYMSRWGYYTICVSEDIWEHLRENYKVSPDRMAVIPNGVDDKVFYPSARSRREKTPRIAFMSRLDSDCSEGAFALLRVAQRLSQRYGKIEICIIGGGESYEELERLSRKINTSVGYPCIRMEGASVRVRELICEADIFVGVSRAALEAMACGVPVLLFGNEGYFGEVREENITSAEKSNFCGRDCPSADSERFFCELCEMLDMEEENRRDRGELLRRYVCENHSLREMAKRNLEVYRKAVGIDLRQNAKACLCGYYGFGNLGDDAILSSAISRARERFGGEAIAFTKSPRRTEYLFGLRCISRLNTVGMYRAMRSTGRLVFGGGTLFQDRTSLRSLLYYVFVAKLARISGASVELWGSGLGPVRSRFGRRLVANMLKNSDHIGLRDKSSIDFAVSLGIKKEKLYLEEDLAMSTPPVTKESFGYIAQKLGIFEGERFAVSSISGRASKRDKEILTKRIKELISRGVKVVMVVSYPDEDEKISRELCEELGIRSISGICPSETVALMKMSVLAVSTRLHLLIFAKAAGVAFEGVGEDTKIVSFCRENGGVILE